VRLVRAWRPDAAGRQALALFRDAPLGARAHVWIRWATCPFPTVAGWVPAAGRMLEVGCGHGLFAAYLALQSPRREVAGVDVDAGKIAVARQAATRARAVGARFDAIVTPSGQLPDGPWDAIIIVDVLYLLETTAQRALLGTCRSYLAPSGLLIVKEMGNTPRWKARWNRAQETVSVRVLRITEGSGLTFVNPTTMATWLRELGLSVESHRLDRGRIHPHHILLGRDHSS
jgi:2-polyprenyl-3-methyl-5-hydroxy-6-metoxy-1,4-benzoquinol methylase